MLVAKTFSQSECDLPGYDQDAWAREIAYQSQPAGTREAALALLTELRRSVTPMLRAATPTQWERAANHPKYDHSLCEICWSSMPITRSHVGQIIRIRELIGRPLAMSLLPPDWLY